MSFFQTQNGVLHQNINFLVTLAIAEITNLASFWHCDCTIVFRDLNNSFV